MTSRKDNFDTSQAVVDLTNRSIRGAAKTGVSQAVRLALQVSTTAVLARILAPEDFGLVAIATVIVGFMQMFSEAGLSTATVQREDISHDSASFLFWVNLGLGLALCLALMAFSPLVAWAFADDRLCGIVVAMAALFVPTSMSIQHLALVQRQMRFGALALLNTVPLAGASVAGMITAYVTQSYWSLVVMAGAQALIKLGLVWHLCRWIPGRPWDVAADRSLLNFGANLTGFNALNYLVRNLDNFLIGICFGPTALGIYSNAYKILLLPISQVSGPINSVAIPALCRLQGDAKRFHAYYTNGLRILTSVSMPLVVFCFVFAEDIVLMALGGQWSDSVPIFRALGPAAFLGTFNVAAGWVLIPLGQAGRQLRIGAVNALCVSISFVVGLLWGPLGVAIAYSTAATLLRIPALLYSLADSPIGIRDIARSIGVPCISSLFAGAFLVLASPVVVGSMPLAGRLVLNGLLFAVIYGCLYTLIELRGLKRGDHPKFSWNARLLRY